MSKYIVRFILRSRLAIILAISVLTIFMAIKARDVRLSYNMAQMLPITDSTSIKYQEFKNTFGEDGAVLFVGICDKDIFNLDEFNDWYDLSYNIKKIDGVEEVISIAKTYTINRNDSLKKFDFNPILTEKPRSQEELDSILNIVFSQPLYEDLLFNKANNSTLMAITLNKNKLNDKSRVQLVQNIEDEVSKFQQLHKQIDIHYSGLPYIRTITSKKIQKELLLFILLAMLIASGALYCFFRSFKAVIFPMLIVIISVICE